MNGLVLKMKEKILEISFDAHLRLNAVIYLNRNIHYILIYKTLL